MTEYRIITCRECGKELGRLPVVSRHDSRAKVPSSTTFTCAECRPVPVVTLQPTLRISMEDEAHVEVPTQ